MDFVSEARCVVHRVPEIEQFNRTHKIESSSFSDVVEAIRKVIIARGDLPDVTVAYQLNVLDQFCEFPLGRFILERKGANGFWTDYMLSHPQKGKISGVNSEGKTFSTLEDFFLNRCPIVVAHQERFRIFQTLTQKLLKDSMVVASIPCGIMRDLLTLDFSGIKNYRIIGVDIDKESLFLANKLAKELEVPNVEFYQEDAWQIQFQQELDIITSSGLNVYEPDPEKVMSLYKRFFKSLKPGGFLITSVITYPPGESVESDWDLRDIAPEDLLLDRVLHKDVLDIRWRNFRSSNELSREFELTGFSSVSIHFDKHRIFPTILAQKPF